LCLDPIPLIDEHDKRPAVRDLLAQHSQAITLVRDLLAQDPYFIPAVHDDLWILRFVLTHASKASSSSSPDSSSSSSSSVIANTARAARSTLKYRHDCGLDKATVDIDALVAAWPCPEHPSLKIRKFFGLLKRQTGDAYQCYWPDRDRGVVNLIELAGMDMHAMVEQLTYEENLATFMAFNEWSHQVVRRRCDDESRCSCSRSRCSTSSRGRQKR
jgi:hypothetical protein